MEPDPGRFERRAFSAAGPVFLVALGAVVLLVLLATLLLAPTSPGLLLGLAVVGGAALVLGLAWGFATNRTEPS